MQDSFWIPQPDSALVKYHHLSTILPVRRPLPSSPLAGPVLSSDTSVVGIEAKDDISGGRASTSSTPSLTSHSQSRLHHGPCKRSPILSSPSSPSPQKAPAIFSSRRLSFRNFVGARKPKMTKSPPSSPPRPKPIQGSHPFNIRSTALEVPPNPYTSLRGVSNAPEAGTGVQVLGSPTHATPPADPSDHWMTANPYAATPRFSRLGMSASNVVLPISAREYRRTSRKASRASMTPSSSTSTSIIGVGTSSISSTRLSHSSPSLTFTTSSSSASSRESLALSPHRSWAPSIENAPDHKGTIEEDVEEEVAEVERSPPGPMERLKKLRLKSSRSHIDISQNPSRRPQALTDSPFRAQKIPPPLTRTALDNQPPPVQSSRKRNVGRFWKLFASID